MERKHNFITDISVLLLFHARPDCFEKVWAEVKKARPSRLFLYQDGPRMVDISGNVVSEPEYSKDWPNIQRCRNLVCDDNIDWDCEVHRNYQDVNAGCDPSEYYAQKWAFSLTEKCIVLEDDDVPSLSFFPFCKEMLDKYENDERITLISGFNTDELTNHNELGDASYFFTRAFSIWGWASWARVVNNWDSSYSFVTDESQFIELKKKAKQYKHHSRLIDLCKCHSESGIEYYETIFWAYMTLHDGLAIMPDVNMINNIGLDMGTHYSTQLNLMPKRLRRQFEMKRHDITFPLVHQKSVQEYPKYQERLNLLNAWDHPWRKIQYSFEELWLNLKVGNIKQIVKAIGKRLLIIFEQITQR